MITSQLFRVAQDCSNTNMHVFARCTKLKTKNS